MTRLRGELTALRNGSSMPPILEEMGGLKSPRLGSTVSDGEVLDLKDRYSELSTRYAKLTADLAKAQSTPQTMSTESFTLAVEPIVEEYEKSISALESQLSLTKAALMHSEEIMREADEKLLFESRTNENHSRSIGDLKSRITKLLERESVTESYVHDLEARLKASAETDEKLKLTVAELKRDISKHREVAVNTEAYVKDLETRLSRSETDIRSQKATVEALEKDIQRREKAYEQIESRLALLDSSEQNKQLLEELDARDRSLLQVQRDLDQTAAALATEKQQAVLVKTDYQAVEREKQDLHNNITSLEQQMARLRSRQSLRPTSLQDDGFTPPQTPGTRESDLLTEEDGKETKEALRKQIADLQVRYDSTIEDLTSLSKKYKETLQEVSILQQQQKARRRRKSSGDSLGSSSSHKSSPSEGQNELHDFFSSASSRFPPSISSSATPNRVGRTAGRRSMPLSPRGSFLGRSPVMTTSASHLRSASLSQELSLAQSLNGHGSSAMGLPTIGTMSPRPVSPFHGSSSKRESLLAMVPQHPPERSNESLLQEVKKLQDTLNERDEEIRELENGLSQSHDPSISASASPASNSLALPIPHNTFLADESLRTPDVSMHPCPFSLSPNTLEAYNAIKDGIDENKSRDLANGTGADQLHRLDDLMLSMAKKEVAHRQEKQDIEEQLLSLQKQHEELKTLNKDQVLNMSGEITGYTQQLQNVYSKTSTLQAKVDTIETQLNQKVEQVKHFLENETQLRKNIEELEQEIQNREDSHSEALAQIQEDQAALLRRMLESKEALFIRKAEEHDAIVAKVHFESQELLKIKINQYNQALLSTRNDFEIELKRKESECEEIKQRLAIQESSIGDADQALLIRQLNEQHESILKSREMEHMEVIQQIKLDHAALLEDQQQSHSVSFSKMQKAQELACEKLSKQHENTLKTVRDEYDATTISIQDKHRQSVAALNSEHELERTTAGQRYNEETTALKQAHAQKMEQLRQEHQEEVESIFTGQLRVLDEENKASLERSISKESEHQAALASCQTSHDEQIKKLLSEHGTTYEAIKEEHRASLLELQMKHEEMLNKQLEGHLEALSEVETVRNCQLAHPKVNYFD